MKRTLFASTTALLVALFGQAIAQSVDVEIAPESRTLIKEHVVREKVAPVRVRERVDVGTLPRRTFNYATVPSDWGPWGPHYRYVYSADGKVYLLEPTRRVVRSID